MKNSQYILLQYSELNKYFNSSQVADLETEKTLDVLELWEGSLDLATSKCLTRLSGSQRPDGILMSSNNFVIARFTADSSKEFRGFSLKWTSG